MPVNLGGGNLVLDTVAINPAAKVYDIQADPAYTRLAFREMEFFSGQTGSFSLFMGDPGAGGTAFYSGSFSANRSRVYWPGRKEVVFPPNVDLWALGPAGMSIFGTMKIRRLSV